MSFATLSNTLDEFSAISTLELTKNPFDSGLDGRHKLPALSSPSIFIQQDTPGSQKKKGFRWSIDQISKLNPAEIDEFPNQEYSSTCERPEDEEKVQEAISEYFSNGTILPSPWTPENHTKHVTFSPHPPSTTYISGDEDSMTDMSHTSPPGNTSDCRRHSVDASCQTSLTFPPLFDLSKIVDSGFYSYVEDECNSATRDLNVSSLRRKLFSPDDNSPVSRDRQPPRPRVTRSILKSPSPMNLLTSSPVQHSYPKPDPDSCSSLSNGARSRTSQSPAVSPIKAQITIPADDSSQPRKGMDELKVEGTFNDDVFHSDVLESSDVHIDPQLIPDVSPIKDTNTAHQQEKLDDGGPMKLSEISHVSMEYENEGSLSLAEMDIAEPHKQVSRDDRTENEPRQPSASRDKIHDVIDDDVMNDDVISANDGDLHKSSDVATESESISVGSGNEGINGVKDRSKIDGVFGRPLDSTGKYYAREVSSCEDRKENMDVNQRGYKGVTRDNGDEALVQRACAAMERADRLVRESSMEQGIAINKETAPSMGFVNIGHVNKPWKHVDKPWKHGDKALYHVNASWHPIDMSTPLVNDKSKNKPLDPDSYNNLLNSFANSKLDQCPRTFSTADEDFGWSQEGRCGGRFVDRTRSKGTGTRYSRSLSEIGTSVPYNSTQDAYLSGRYGYNGLAAKRYSWPLWKSSRARSRSGYKTVRNSSHQASSGLSAPRRRSAEDLPRLHRSSSDDLKRYSKALQYSSPRKREDYLNFLRPDLRRNFRL